MHLRMFHLSLASNCADLPSRMLALPNSKLAGHSWARVQVAFGPYSADLMAITSNVQVDVHVCPLPFFFPYLVPGTLGVNLFSQSIGEHPSVYSNPYEQPKL